MVGTNKKGFLENIIKRIALEKGYDNYGEVCNIEIWEYILDNGRSRNFLKTEIKPLRKRLDDTYQEY